MTETTPASCPFCKSALNPGATVCSHCGATEIAQRNRGRVLALGCFFPFIASCVLGLVIFSLGAQAARTGEASTLPATGFAIMCGVWVLGLILAARVPKKPIWVRRIG